MQHSVSADMIEEKAAHTDLSGCLDARRKDIKINVL